MSIRVSLRQIKYTDIDAIHEYASDPNVTK